jgi:hypothetical protein
MEIKHNLEVVSMDLREQLFLTQDVEVVADSAAVEAYRKQEAFFAARDRLRSLRQAQAREADSAAVDA